MTVYNPDDGLCPFCGRDDTVFSVPEYVEPYTDDKGAHPPAFAQEVRCTNCKQSWTDFYPYERTIFKEGE